MSGARPTNESTLSRIAGETLLAGYRLFGRLVTPLLPLLHARRMRRGKEDPARRGERFGRASLARPDGPLVWLHAASVGEMNAAQALIASLAETGVTVLLTTGTVTSARIAASQRRPGVLHQFVPYDTPGNISRFLDHWRPDLAITLESEIWPTTIHLLHARGIPLVIASATMSERTRAGWNKVPFVARRIFSRLTLCLAQTQGDAERLAGFGVPRVEVSGNLKYDSQKLAADPRALEDLRTALGSRPRWLAASTHEGEETIAASVHETLEARGLADLVTIVVPRHPERGEIIANDLSARGLRVARRSAGEIPDAGTQIYLADTIGELGLFYRLAPVAFIGKSLVPEGGQNPLEAARLSTAILTGPHVFNLQDIYTPLIDAGGALVVEDEARLTDQVERLLRDPDAARHVAVLAGDVTDAGSGALAATLDALSSWLPIPARQDGT
uniref:3-deoxy-D-manno-octulosonic acid transferase n=1 Tax=Stappia sp. TaxID=1870903 RepID=UPI003BAA88E9